MNTKVTIKFNIQNKPHLSSLLLMAAFLKHSDDLYEQTGVQVAMAVSGCTALWC